MSFVPPRPQPLFINGPVGKLQAIVEEPEATPYQHCAVLCHLHPLYGGTMTNKIIHTLARTFNELGVPTVRFNYRGVGESEGSYDEGIGETEDAFAVIKWAQVRWSNAPLWLAGVSFGGGVALRAAQRTPVERMVMVAPAVARDAPIANLPTYPWLIVQGDADDVVPAQMVTDWVSQMPSPPGLVPELTILPGVGHYFHGHLGELREVVRNWLSRES
jgi:alpha/beta superfamily hydrolase